MLLYYLTPVIKSDLTQNGRRPKIKTTKNKDDQQLYEKRQGNGATLASSDLFSLLLDLFPRLHLCFSSSSFFWLSSFLVVFVFGHLCFWSSSRGGGPKSEIIWGGGGGGAKSHVMYQNSSTHVVYQNYSTHVVYQNYST